MQRRFVSFCFMLSILLFAACGGEEVVSPIEPAGVSPTLFGAIAADDYMALGYLDLVALRDSQIGIALIEKLGAAGPIAQKFDLSVVRRAGFAVSFDSRSWPNAWRAFRAIIALESKLSPGGFEAILEPGSFERGNMSFATVFRFPGAGAMFGSPDDDFSVAFPGSGVVLMSNDEELIMRSMAAMRGDVSRLEDDALTKTRFYDIADLAAPGWFVARLGAEGRNLLQMLPQFEHCVGRLTASETLEGLTVFAFADSEGARRMVAGHEVNLKNMEKFSSLLDEAGGGEAWIAFLEKMEVSKAGKMAVFKMMYDIAGLDEIAVTPRNVAEDTPEDTAGEGQ